MASIISAGTTSGTALNMTSDTSGSLVLATNGGTTAVTIGTDQKSTFAGQVIVPAAGIKFSDNTTQTSAAASVAPTITTYTSGSGTYTTPAGAKYLIVEMVGAGGGGGGGGTTGSAGSAGGNTTFGSNTCNGGSGGAGASGWGVNQGGAGGGTTLATGTAIWQTDGGKGSAGIAITNTVNQWQFSVPSGMGGSTPLGQGGAYVQYQGGGNTPNSNTGAGGAGGGPGYGTSPAAGGSGGGAGGYIKCLINSPASTYSYAIGSGGSYGSGNYSTGGTGAAGYIVVLAYF